MSISFPDDAVYKTNLISTIVDFNIINLPLLRSIRLI